MLTRDWINFVVLIRTAKKTKRVKKIISAKRTGGISISPKETMNKFGEHCIKRKNTYNQPIINQPIRETNIYKAVKTKKAKAKR